MAEFLHAGDAFVTEGERRAAEILKRLPDRWVVIANKVVPLNGTTSREIDFIVIGDRLVFVIDEKSWHGRIHGTDYEWVRDDGSAERSPLGKIDWVAKAIRGHLNRKVVGFDAVTAQCVVGCVLLSRATERPVLQDPRAKQGVVLLKDAVAHLTARDAAEGDPWISEIRRNIRSTFVNMQYRPKIPTRIGDYTIVEEIPAPGDGRRFRATHADGEPRELAMYPDPKDPIKREFYGSEQRLYKRSQLTGLVPRVYDHIRWSDDQLVFVFAPPAGLSLPARPRPGNHQAVIEEIALARATFASLAIVHGAGVTHRALSPANVFDNGPDASPRVAFAGFFAARQEDGKRTIQAELDDLHLDDVYAAPEIQAMGYGFADQATDVYSLALIFLERWSGTSIDDLHRDGHGAIQIPEPGDGWPYVPDPLLTDLTRFFRQAINTGSLVSGDGGVVARPTTLECESELAKVLDRAVPRPVPMTGDTLADGRYEILRVLGTGATARTFLARDLVADGLFTLKQFLRPEIMAANGRISGEFNALRMSDHPRIPRVFEIYPANGDVHLKLDYIAGDKLGEVIGRYRHDVAACHALAQDVLGAIAHLESLELLHRDVKPDNIVIQNGTGFAYLIDFGATTTLARRTAAAGTPIYAPPESWLASEPPRSADRYAAAAVLFEALTGRLPWLQNQSLFDRQVMTDDEIGDLPAEARRYATVLLRALHPDPARRHGSAAELSADLDQARRAAIEPSPGRSRGEEKINPTVGSIRGLFRNSTGGNADNRGLDTEFAFSTYVETALDTRLLPEILARRPRAVFLSGNPGDGKTAFLGRVERALGDRGGTRVTTDPSGWEWSMDGHAFRACYDASESHDGRSADEQLRGRLGGLEGDGLPNAHPTVLVAINDGRLAEFVAHHRETHGWLTRQIEVASRPDQPRQDGDVWVVDLKRRAFVSLHEGGPGTASVMRRILAELVAPDRWRACEGCVAAAVCPIRRNALVLDAAPGRPTANRLEHLLRLSHLRGQRHLTVRDLRSGLAYLITGDRDCVDIHAANRESRALPEIDFWRTVFTTPTTTDIMLGELQVMDPGRSPQPFLERHLFFHRTDADAGLRRRIFTDGQDVPPVSNQEHDQVEWIKTVKRRFFFHGVNAGGGTTGLRELPWVRLLPYRSGGQFMNALSGDIDLGETILPVILRGLSRSDGLRGDILDAGLCLTIADSPVNRLTVLKVFPIERFTLAISGHGSAEVIETVPDGLVLTYRNERSAASLLIRLDLFELLHRLADGLEPTSPEFMPLLEDLVPFKSQVQLSETRDLILIESGRRYHLLTQRDGKVVREDYAPRGTSEGQP